MKNNGFEDIADTIKSLESKDSASLTPSKKRFKRVPTTIMMATELKKIFKTQYIDEGISMSTLVEKLLIKEFKEKGHLDD